MPRNRLHYYLLMIYYTVRNKLFPIYTGPSSVRFIGWEEKIPKVLQSDKKIKSIRVNYSPRAGLKKLANYDHFTLGRIYQAERQDRISYYVKDDIGHLCEMNKEIFEDVTEIRNKRLKKIGI